MSTQLKALRTLKEAYASGIGLDYCPLCRVNEICETCVWVKFTGEKCPLYIGPLRENPELSRKGAKERVEQINEWITKLKETV